MEKVCEEKKTEGDSIMNVDWMNEVSRLLFMKTTESGDK